MDTTIQCLKTLLPELAKNTKAVENLVHKLQDKQRSDLCRLSDVFRVLNEHSRVIVPPDFGLASNEHCCCQVASPQETEKCPFQNLNHIHALIDSVQWIINDLSLMFYAITCIDPNDEILHMSRIKGVIISKQHDMEKFILSHAGLLLDSHDEHCRELLRYAPISIFRHKHFLHDVIVTPYNSYRTQTLESILDRAQENMALCVESAPSKNINLFRGSFPDFVAHTQSVPLQHAWTRYCEREHAFRTRHNNGCMPWFPMELCAIINQYAKHDWQDTRVILQGRYDYSANCTGFIRV